MSSPSSTSAIPTIGTRTQANGRLRTACSKRSCQPWCAARGIEFAEISARTGYLIRPENQGARSLFGWLWQMTQIPVAGPNRICTRIAKVERFEAWLDRRFAGQEVEVRIGFDAAEQSRIDNIRTRANRGSGGHEAARGS